jgi:hypothetical protein
MFCVEVAAKPPVGLDREAHAPQQRVGIHQTHNSTQTFAKHIALSIRLSFGP